MSDQDLKRAIHELDIRFTQLIQKSPKTPAEIVDTERVGNALETALRREVASLTDDLRNVGVRADVWDLVNTSVGYPRAIPILIKHLDQPYHRRNKEGIVRALAVKEARGIASKAVMDEYRRTPKADHHFLWTFGNTMSVIAVERDLEDLVEIVMNESNGDSRQMFIRALAKLKSPKVIDTLHHLANDKSTVIAREAANALKRKTRSRQTTRD